MKLDQAKRIFSEMKQTRASWISAWKEIAQYIAPTSGSFDDDPKSKQGKKIDHKTLLDQTAGLAVSILAAGMMSGLTSPSRSWFELTLEEDKSKISNAVSRWLAEVKQILESVFAKSNVYNVLHNFYEEVAVFCTGAFLVEEDYETVLHCRSFTIGEYMLGENERGQVDRFAREFYMTTYQMVKQFGIDGVPATVKQQYLNQRYDALHKVYHLIAPNPDKDSKNPSSKAMPWTSLYWTDGAEGLLRQSGYQDFPVIAARWELKRSSDVYGRGPGWSALGDVKMLQKMQKTMLVALDKSTNPPMMVSSKVQGEINLMPGGITRYNDTTDASVKPVYQVNPDLKSLDYSLEQVRRRIREVFFADMFLMISNADAGKMTATEVAERSQEKMMMLGPVLERLKNELLDPLIERAFNICMRAGILPPPPEEIQGRDLHVSYISMIAQAQKASGLNTIRQGAQFAAELAQIQAAAGAAVLDNVDFDGALREGLSAIGTTPKMIRGEEDVQSLRQERTQAAQEAAQQAQMAQAIQSAKTLAETPLNTGSALDAVAQGANPNV